MSLDFEELYKANFIRCSRSFHVLSDWSETDWACAAAGEVGEMCNLIKKRRRGEDISTEEVGKEIADAVIYLDLLATRMEMHLGDLVRAKFNEVSDRVHSEVKL